MIHHERTAQSMEHMKWKYSDEAKEVKRKKNVREKKNLRKNLREKDQTHIETFVWNTFEINKDLSWFVFFEFSS